MENENGYGVYCVWIGTRYMGIIRQKLKQNGWKSKRHAKTLISLLSPVARPCDCEARPCHTSPRPVLLSTGRPWWALSHPVCSLSNDAFCSSFGPRFGPCILPILSHLVLIWNHLWSKPQIIFQLQMIKLVNIKSAKTLKTSKNKRNRRNGA